MTAMSVLAAIALIGCTGMSAPAPTPTATTVDTAQWPTNQLFHIGRDTASLEVPAGAKSLHVDFSCTAGLYEIAPATGTDNRSGMCGGAQTFDFDVATVHTGTRLQVEFVVPDDTRFVATTRFGADPFIPDKTTANQCAALSKITEAYYNADEGFEHKDVTADQWATAIADAKTQLTAMAAKSKADSASAGLLGQVIPQLAAYLTSAGDHPGGVLHAPLGDYTAASSLAGQICSSNGTTITVNSTYGG
jgi:hypothetical protein